MTLLHQAAQKAVEALTSIADFDQWNWSDRETVRQMKVIARAALESAALQHQEEPREPVAHFPIIYAILRPALSTGNIAVRQHAERLAEVLEGDQLAAVRELLDRQPAASPSTTRQQEVGSGWKLVPETITEEMHVAAVRTAMRCSGNDDFPRRVWCAMLAAAPSTPEKAGGVSDGVDAPEEGQQHG